MFGSKDPIKQLEKELEKEAKASEKALHHAHNELESVVKAETKAAKAEDKAISHQQKVEKVENKTAHKLAEAKLKHDNALRDQNAAERAIANAQEQHARLKAEVDNRKAFVGQTTEHQTDSSERSAAFLEPLRKGHSPTHANPPPPGASYDHGPGGAAPQSNLATSDLAGQPSVHQPQGQYVEPGQGQVPRGEFRPDGSAL